MFYFYLCPKSIANLLNLEEFHLQEGIDRFIPDNEVSFLSKGFEPRVFIQKSDGKIVCGCALLSLEDFLEAIVENYDSMEEYCIEFAKILHNN